jgi:hypothetical protein
MAVSFSGSLDISGSLNTTGTITMSGSIASASYADLATTASNAVTSSYVVSSVTDATQNTRLTTIEAVTGSYATTSSFGAYTSSNDTLNSTQNSRISANEAKTGSYATTGSNQFAASQTITGSLTVTGNINAQTLVVQTITSSIDFVTGSTRFGSNTGNTHQFTGSILVSGSQTINGTLGVAIGGVTELNVQQTGVTLGSVIGDLHRVTGSLNVSGSITTVGALTGSSAVFNGNVILSSGGDNLTLARTGFTSWGLGVGTVSGINGLHIGAGSSTYLSFNQSSGAATFSGSIATTRLLVGGATGNFLIDSYTTSMIGIRSWTDTAGTTNNFFIQNNANFNYGVVGVVSASGTSTGDVYGLGYTPSAGTSMTSVINWTSNGRVGIGTTSPSELLDIRGANRDISSGEFNQVIYTTTTHDLGRGGSIAFGGTTNGTSSITSFGGIKGQKENGDGGNTAGALTFHTRPNAGAMTERVRITSDGNVGIGTTNPGSALHIYKSVAYNTINDSLVIQGGISGGNSSSPAYYGGIKITTGDYDWMAVRVIQNSPAASWLNRVAFFGMNGPAGSLIERMCYDFGGNVGIGTTSPSATLDVVGAVRGYSYALTSDAVFRGGLYPYKFIAGSGTDYGVTIFAEGGTGNGNIYFCPNGSATRAATINTSGRLIVGSTSDGATGLVQIHGTARAVQLVASEGGITAGNYAVYGHDDDNGYINIVRSVFTGDFHFRFDGTTRSNINRSTGVYTATSDSRLKTNISDSQNVLSLIDQIKVRSYNWIESNVHEPYGLVAQELHEILPQYVYEPKNENENWGLSKSELVPMLIKAIQELKAELNTANQKITALELAQ